MADKYVDVEVPSYDWGITLKKFFTGLGLTLIPVIILYAIEFFETETFPPEFTLYIPLIVAILHALLNYLKHCNDSKVVEGLIL